MEKIKLPKVENLRFGQLLYNALIDACIWEKEASILDPYQKIIQHRDIFHMSDEQLERILNKFLEKYEEVSRNK